LKEEVKGVQKVCKVVISEIGDRISRVNYIGI